MSETKTYSETKPIFDAIFRINNNIKYDYSVELTFEDDKYSQLTQHSDYLDGTVNLTNINSIMNDRYDICQILGEGAFGTVLACIDNKHDINVAIKIMHSFKTSQEIANREQLILNKLYEADINRNSLIIRLYKLFHCEINNIHHPCLVFEKLGYSLKQYIDINNNKGLSSLIIANIGYQLFHSIAFCHSNKLIHTDLKLSNILFVDDTDCNKTNKYDIRLIDFGNAIFENEYHSSIITTEPYRSIEVLLGLKWSYPTDIWSLGCILTELYTGHCLFVSNNDIMHLMLIKQKLNVKEGLFPNHMINDGNRNILHHVLNEEVDDISINYVKCCKGLKEKIDDDKLYDLINKCLQIDPNKRITALEAKNHSFFLQYRNNKQFRRIYNKCNVNFT